MPWVFPSYHGQHKAQIPLAVDFLCSVQQIHKLHTKQRAVQQIAQHVLMNIHSMAEWLSGYWLSHLEFELGDPCSIPGSCHYSIG